ncbi:MAG: twin-arginine translocase TatA/TatE family subunit [Muribaculaceae bacterium]|nr:twin-arginine translocase TatA/TatE family subunit [Muribaculaceae bacterium]
MFVPLFLGNLRPFEIVIIILAILLLFGAKRIPSMMRNIGKGINSFKQGMRDMQEEIKKDPQSTDADNSKETPSADKH